MVGHWDGDRFAVDNGRHEYLSLLMIGRERVLVRWRGAGADEAVSAACQAVVRRPGICPYYATALRVSCGP